MSVLIAPPEPGFAYLGLRGFSRKTAVITTASLADDSTANGLVTLGQGWRLMAVESSHPARLRMYATTSHRTVDASRPIGTDPDTTTDHGLLFEFVFDPTLLEAVLSPLVDGFCPAGNQAPFALTNLSGSATVLGVNLTYVRTE